MTAAFLANKGAQLKTVFASTNTCIVNNKDIKTKKSILALKCDTGNPAEVTLTH